MAVCVRTGGARSAISITLFAMLVGKWWAKSSARLRNGAVNAFGTVHPAAAAAFFTAVSTLSLITQREYFFPMRFDAAYASNWNRKAQEI